jgi:hypothetical protein
MKTAFLLMLGLGLFTAAPVAADSLDGNWCSKDGRRMHIEGATIMTPGGSKLQGVYERHTFSYTVPASEPGAGSFVFLQQWSEERMDMYVGTDEVSARQAVGQEWNRCAPTTS